MLYQQLKSTILRYRLRALGLGALVVIAVVALSGAEAAPGAPPVNRYIGVDRCKLCHSAEDRGDQYHVWKNSKHASAYATLATDKAKQQAKAAGVENPQTDPKCITCHETGYGLPEGSFAKSFVAKQGVQCESCHGPGEKHVSERLKAVDDVAPGGGRRLWRSGCPAGRSDPSGRNQHSERSEYLREVPQRQESQLPRQVRF
jgi:hypothetical protein